MIKIECNNGKTSVKGEGSFFEVSCIIATLIQKSRELKYDDFIIKTGIETALECLEKEGNKNE